VSLTVSFAGRPDCLEVWMHAVLTGAEIHRRWQAFRDCLHLSSEDDRRESDRGSRRRSEITLVVSAEPISASVFHAIRTRVLRSAPYNECNLACAFCYRDPTRADRLSLIK